MTSKIGLISALAVFSLASCGDKPVMSLPNTAELVGTWECQPLHTRAEQAMGKAAASGRLVLNQNGSFQAKSFPMNDPLRLVDTSGRWELLDPTMTPSGVCSIELDGVFLSIRRRGDQLVLHYPVVVLEHYSAEYIRKK